MSGFVKSYALGVTWDDYAFIAAEEATVTEQIAREVARKKEHEIAKAWDQGRDIAIIEERTGRNINITFHTATAGSSMMIPHKPLQSIEMFRRPDANP